MSREIRGDNIRAADRPIDRPSFTLVRVTKVDEASVLLDAVGVVSRAVFPESVTVNDSFILVFDRGSDRPAIAFRTT